MSMTKMEENLRGNLRCDCKMFYLRVPRFFVIHVQCYDASKKEIRRRVKSNFILKVSIADSCAISALGIRDNIVGEGSRS